MARSESWRSVPGHSNQFVASTLGRIARVIGHSGANGYQQISFKRSMKPFKAHSQGLKWPAQSRGYAHHLVALAFLGKPPKNKTQVNHKDNNRANNRPTNLQWSDQRENILHAWATGRIPRKRLHRLPDETVKLIIVHRRAGNSYAKISKYFVVHMTTVGYRIREAKRKGLL